MDPSTNGAYGTILGGTILGSAGSPVTIILQTGEGAAFPGGGGAPGGEYDVTIWPPGVRPLLTNMEMVRVTRTGDTLSTTARGRGGTTPNASIVAGYQVMAGPTALNPKLGIERLGIAPYDFEPGPLIWDEVYLKRVSPKFLLWGMTHVPASIDNASAQNTAYAEVVSFAAVHPLSPYGIYGDLIAAGFTLQIRLLARIGVVVGGAAFIQAGYRPVTVDAALGAFVGIAATELQSSATAPGIVKDSGWVDSGLSGAEDFLRFGIQMKHSTGAGSSWGIGDGMTWGRWVK